MIISVFVYCLDATNITCGDIKDWEDYYHFDCDLYEGAKWCNSSGQPGTGWRDGINQYGWPSLAGYANNISNLSAADACCACGGGNSSASVEYVPLDPYPYEGLSTTCMLQYLI